MNQLIAKIHKPSRPPGICLPFLPLLAPLVLLSAWTGPAAEPEHGRRCHFIAIENFTAFKHAEGENPAQTILTSPELNAPFPWDELVVSWNAIAPSGTGLKIEARALHSDRATRFYILGLWSEDPDQLPRESVRRQRDEDGAVHTDTLVLRQPAQTVQLRITLTQSDDQTMPSLKFLSLSFLDSAGQAPWREPNRKAWGRVLSVPQRSQIGFPGASGWCSPTCISMMLAYWARELVRPELDWAVPDVARAVYDPKWTGTGNWVFNTAFAGRFPGLQAYTTRVQDLRAIEDWIAAGIPVAASVSSDVLRGAPRDQGNGHLIVCVGFTKDGDVVTNDPWAILPKGESVRRTYPREVFIRSWERSKSAIYVIHPIPSE